jgi:hypothetical protein
MIGMLAERFVQPGTQVYDLGCSLGAATVDPTTQSHLLPHVGQTELSTIFCTHEISLNLAAGGCPLLRR